ncbi:hypothetical protein FJY63_14660 [Candidatus Sumerlaeota bacterium]|nr:hypothetical protein [Candidatus Sumerlaeota bacterium]
MADGKTYAIIPDCPGLWVKSAQLNPLPIDWAQPIELNKVELVNRVVQQLESIRSANVVIVQKVEALALPHGYLPLIVEYPVVDYVCEHFKKVGETKFFEIYE